MAVDSFSHPFPEVLDDLDPLSRALLDLSLKQGMSDEEIAEVLSSDAEAVYESRVALMRSVAERVAPETAGAEVPELQAALCERLYGVQPAGAEPEAVEAEPVEAEPEAAAEPESERKRRSPLPVVGVLLVVAALIVAMNLIAGGDDDEEQGGGPAPAQRAERDAARLSPLTGGNASGTATVRGDQLDMQVRGLPTADGFTYEVWLYNSVIEARRIGRLDSDGRLKTTLPEDRERYQFLDVSREPRDGNPNHSGQSVLRVTTRARR